ncbi:MAG: GTP 3',8-cyclase MoaA [Deltaproteobacteria bacterium]|nr:GTP 3',8-cyclase MoaA [Deltaproteobacteria bacterium]MBW2070837.1 GTP 3',8-cyclase MoaA [Deltaproteobacteria bacterium]
MTPPIDHYHRPIDYLRVSITDRCNLRCVYCVPATGVHKLSHHDILTYEELLRLTRIALDMGISKVRLTGGEPLVRKGVIDFCQRLARLPGLDSLSLTTNGVLLEQFCSDLYHAGMRRINISLDTLQPEKFARITRFDLFEQVWRGIRAAEQIGFAPIKLNVVVMRGINDDEIVELAQLTTRHAFHVRFIEFMPLTTDDTWVRRHYVSADEILATLSGRGPLEKITVEHTNGPARHFRWADAPGVIGIISPISHHFCPSCNRIRLTADGNLRNCLFSDHEVDIKSAMRQGATDSELAAILRQSIAEKPKNHFLQSDLFHKCHSRPMVAIGG